MRRGPKPTATSTPLDLRRLPKQRAARCIKWIETYCVVPDGYGAGKPMRLRPWQREFIEGVYQKGIKVAALSVPKGNGKTGLLACICLYQVFGAGTFAPRVYATASSERQAGILFGACKAMVELHPDLLARSELHASKIVVPGIDGLLEPLPASSKSLQGYRPAFLCLDEAAEVADSTFEALSLSLGKRPNSKMVCISTAPLSEESFWNRLRDLGLSGEDDSLLWKEWSAPEGADISDPAVWAACNPAYGDFLDPEAITSDFRKVRPESFARWRLNMCTADSGAWLEWGQWEGLAAPRQIPAGTRVVLGFDGSVAFDSTAIVAVTVEERPYVALQGLWERPAGVKEWRVPRHEVTAMVDALYAKYDVVEMACDPHHWRSEIEAWAVVHPTVIEFATHTPSMMCPATDRAFALIAEGKVSHDGDERLARHIRNARVRPATAGVMLTKAHAGPSAPKMDACVATVIALERAAWHYHNAPKRRRVYAF